MPQGSNISMDKSRKSFKQIKTVMNQGKNGPPKNKKEKHESYLIPKVERLKILYT
jgi:hypothetical protein